MLSLRTTLAILAQRSTRALQLSAVSRSIDEFETKTALRQMKDTAIDSYEYFESSSDKNRRTFHAALDMYTRRSGRRRGEVEFIKAAVKNMKQFGVHRDLDAYKAIIDIMPKSKYVPSNMWQADFYHYPKQQDCIVDVLSAMYKNGVVPDRDLGALIKNIFGIHSKPFKKYLRMVYWMCKFKNLSPWPIPHYLPNSTLELAKMAISQITSVDRDTSITIYDAQVIPESIDKTWIVSGQSPVQKEMITSLPKDKALFVEGAFRVWLRDAQVNYFVLRGEPVARPPPSTKDIDDVSGIKMWMLGECDDEDLVHIPNTHEQEDGTILACCATGTSSRDSLLSWVRLLQRDNPDLTDIPILFTLTSPLGPVIPIDKDSKGIKQS